MDWVRALLAALPILSVLILMAGLGWSAVRAAVPAAAGTLLIAVVVFDFGLGDESYDPVAGLAGVVAEAAWVTATVIAIIGPALAVHELQQRTGSTQVLQEGLGRLSADPRIPALLVAWYFSLFLEGAAGFGTPVALAAPFLVGVGFRPVAAVTASMVGHAVGVSFGAVGTPVLAQSTLVTYTPGELARATVRYHTLLGWILLAVVVVIVGRAVGNGRAPWGWALVAGVTFFVPYFLIGHFVGPELPTLGAAAIGAPLFVVIVAHARRRRPDEPAAGRTDPEMEEPGASERIARRSIVAGAPYLVLIGLILVTRLVAPLRDTLTSVVLDWSLFGAFSGRLEPLYHPGMLLFIAFLAGAGAQGAGRAAVRRTIADTNRRLVPVAGALLAMVTIAQTMSQSGMTGELAAAAGRSGDIWPVFAPVVGALGTFVTGSATASNLLFTDFQISTAEATGYSALTLSGAQGFGAAVGNIVCPHNLVAAAATVGLAGEEGRVLRRTLPIALVYLVAGGLLALVLVI